MSCVISYGLLELQWTELSQRFYWNRCMTQECSNCIEQRVSSLCIPEYTSSQYEIVRDRHV